MYEVRPGCHVHWCSSSADTIYPAVPVCRSSYYMGGTPQRVAHPRLVAHPRPAVYANQSLRRPTRVVHSRDPLLSLPPSSLTSTCNDSTHLLCSHNTSSIGISRRYLPGLSMIHPSSHPATCRTPTCLWMDTSCSSTGVNGGNLPGLSMIHPSLLTLCPMFLVTLHGPPRALSSLPIVACRTPT